MRKKIWQTELKCVCGNLNGGNINFVKSERSNCRKHIIIEILNPGNIKWRRFTYVVNDCLEKTYQNLLKSIIWDLFGVPIMNFIPD